jgi:AcrR family transcriptional regulator
MSTRTRILEVAGRLVAESADGDISTRAVCGAAHVGAPALYRNFGDKEGLLSAVVGRGFGAYLATKRERGETSDPVQDLRNGWDSHVEFALLNPNLYRLMNSPAPRTPPAAALESHEILTQDLRRAAELGKLRLTLELAAQMITSANVGVALMLVSRPATFSDSGMSARVRDAVHAAVFTPDVYASKPLDTEVPSTTVRLGALLRRSRESGLGPVETALMTEWLDRCRIPHRRSQARRTDPDAARRARPYCPKTPVSAAAIRRWGTASAWRPCRSRVRPSINRA